MLFRNTYQSLTDDASVSHPPPPPSPTMATNSLSAGLSSNDAAVLGQLFDPESAAAAAHTITVDPSLPRDPHIADPVLLQSLHATELRAIQLAESGDLHQARTLLTSLTLSHPDYASAFNNLAQVLRMLTAPPDEILNALSRAIALAAPASTGTAVSPRQANLLGQAYTQRGAMLYTLFMKEGAEGAAREKLELAASKDFYEGGRYGNEVGREMAVRTNPYARLCGAIVREALTRDYGGGS